MSYAKLYAALFGAVYTLVGVLGLAIPGGTALMPTPLLLFDINLLHNLAHLLVGVIQHACEGGHLVGILALLGLTERGHPRPITPYYLMLSTTLQPEFSAVLVGRKSPERAIRDASM